MKKNIEKQDKIILKTFIENNIPSYIREKSINNWDLMDCYEEIFNYSHSLLNGNEIDININTIETDKSFIFDKEYRDILIFLSNDSDDINLKIHCYLSLAVLCVIQKYASIPFQKKDNFYEQYPKNEIKF